MLRDITKHINEVLIPNLPNNSKLVDIAEIALAKDGDGEKSFPVLMDNNGDGIYVGPDSDWDFFSYHRVIDMRFTRIINSGYGDSLGVVMNKAQMVMVVFGRRDRLKRSADEVGMILEGMFPDSVNMKPFKKVSISVNNIVLDSMRVFGEEFQGIDFFLPPDQFLIKVNYTIESTYLKECFTTCL